MPPPKNSLPFASDEEIQRAMQRLANVQAMQAMDRRAIKTLGLPARLLMENAARALTNCVLRCWKGLQPATKQTMPKVVVCCGVGGNGGDGYAAARMLANSGCSVIVIALAPPKHTDTLANAKVWEHFGPLLYWNDAQERACQALKTGDVLVDALFGIGLNRTIQAKTAALIDAMNQNQAPFKISADIPSGIHADTGALLGKAVQATHTVSFQIPKQGIFLSHGAIHAGQVLLEDISIPPYWQKEWLGTWQIATSGAAKLLAKRPVQAHKGVFGRGLLLCGSQGMGGAALLAAFAALRSGAGLVTLGTPRCLENAALAVQPELIQSCSVEGPSDHFHADQVDFFVQAASTQNALAFGCGVGRKAQTGLFIKALLQSIQKPIVVDADGLYHVTPEELAQCFEPCIITPHPGEFARLFGVPVAQQAENPLLYARKAALQSRAVVVLKGASTVVASPDGRAFINSSGDVGLATAGSGDVLTGVLCALLAQGLPALWAAVLGVHLHGLARDTLARRTHAAYFNASDLLTGLNTALQQLTETAKL